MYNNERSGILNFFESCFESIKSNKSSRLVDDHEVELVYNVANITSESYKNYNMLVYIYRTDTLSTVLNLII